jgi:Uncharacterized conserved protein
MYHVDLAAQTVFADLKQRVYDAAFDRDFPENGNFHKHTVKGRQYWYYNGYDAVGGKTKKYVGPASDPEVTARAEAFGRVKVAFKSRMDAVSMLKAAGFPAPDPLTGLLVDRIAKAGFFRLRGVLVGTVAFQTYPGLVGARPERHLQTGDVDLAQDHGISVAVDERADSLVEAILSVDPGFRPVPRLDSKLASRFVNAQGYKVEFLSTNRGSDDNAGHAVPLPSLGVAAEPLRFMDFLLRDPVQSVLLTGGGVSVTVPSPERYAVHKMIISTRRQDKEKAAKDIGQASFLVEALTRYGSSVELAGAWVEAWGRGQAWRDALAQGKGNLTEAAAQGLQQAVVAAGEDLGFDPREHGFDAIEANTP